MKKSAFENFSEDALSVLDFARCQRPDGSFYGTGGTCRKGTPVGEKQKDQVGTGKPSKAIKSGGLGEMTIKTEADMKKMSDAELKSHMKLANKVAFQGDVDKLTKAQFDGLADQHKMAKAELSRREGGKKKVTLDKASRAEYAKQAKTEKQSVKDIKDEMRRNGKTPALQKKLEMTQKRADKFERMARTGLFEK